MPDSIRAFFISISAIDVFSLGKSKRNPTSIYCLKKMIFYFVNNPVTTLLSVIIFTIYCP